MNRSRTTPPRQAAHADRALLVSGLRWLGVGLVVLGPVAALVSAAGGFWPGAVLGGAAGICGLLCVLLAAMAGAVFEIADRARALGSDPRFQ